MKRILQYSLVFFILTLFAFQSVQAAPSILNPGEQDIDIDQISINLNDLDPGWVSVYAKLKPEKKIELLNQIKNQIKLSASQLSEFDQQQLTILNSLLDKLVKINSPKSDDKKSSDKTEARKVLKAYSLNALLDLYQEKSNTADDIAILEADLKQLKTVIEDASNRVSSALVEYRGLPKQTLERFSSALAIVRIQSEILLSKERHSELFLSYESTREREVVLKQQLRGAVELLEFNKKDVDKRHKKLRTIENEIAKKSKEMIRFEQSSLSLDSGVTAFDTRLNRLVLLSASINYQARRSVLNLELEVDSGIDSGDISLASEALNEWKSIKPHFEDVDKKFKDMFSLLVVKEQEMNQVQRNKAWTQMMEVKANIDSINKMIRLIGFLEKVRLDVAQSQSDWFPWLLATVESNMGDLWSRMEGWRDYPLFSVGERPITVINLLIFILLIAMAFGISRIVRSSVRKVAEKKGTVSESALFTLGRVFHYSIIIIAILTGLSFLGINAGKLVIVAGALSVGIGFGLRSIFNNFLSGLILLFERHVKVGDLVSLESGVRGRIKAIKVRSTQLTTWDNIDVLVPNSELISGRVTNYTFGSDLRRVHVSFGVAYGSDKNLVRKAVIEAALKVHFTVNNKVHSPEVWLVEMAESSLNFELVVWIRGNRLSSRESSTATYLWEIETSLNEYGIEIPFPQRDIHVKSGGLIQ